MASDETAKAGTDPRAELRTRAMTVSQLMAIGLCILINMMDGFDILVASFTAPAISESWGLAAQQVGILLSSGLAGMMAGALLLSPLADVFGRRRLVLVAVSIIGTGMLTAALSQNLTILVIARFITGAGVGGMMPAINTVVAELANNKRRDFAICLQACGFPMGGLIGGFAVYTFDDYSWRAIYWAGAGFAVLLVPLIVAWLPESYDFLLERRPKNALARVNALSTRFALPTLAQLPPLPCNKEAGTSREALRGGLKERAILMCVAFFLLMFTFYFLTSWTPKLLTEYGFSTRSGVSGAIFMNLGGVVGDLVFSALTLRWPAQRLGPMFLIAAFVTAALFAFAPLTLAALLPLAFALGFLLFGSMASLYAIVPAVFPARLRASGTGLALGLGRAGATIGPYLGGVVIGFGWDRPVYVLLMSLPLLICAAVVGTIATRLATSKSL